jgi:plastocyanin
MWRVDAAPGRTGPLHAFDTEQVWTFLEGAATIDLGGETLTVAPGDTVTWDNEDVFIHTVTADSGAWSSPELRRGQRYVLVPSDTGRFTYHCAAHAIMHGVLVVRR